MNKKIIATVLAITMITSSFTNWATPTLANVESGVKNSVINHADVDYVTVNKEMQSMAIIGENEQETLNEVYGNVGEYEESVDNLIVDILPKAFDISKDEYFPEVGDQSSVGNCGYWSGYYTTFTYHYNKSKGIKTEWANSHNPMFGFAFYGRSKESADAIGTQIGYPTFGVLPLDYNGTNTFSPTKEVWEDAVKHRFGGWEDFKRFGNEDEVVTGPDDFSLYQIKSLISQDRIVGVGTLSGKWNYSYIPSGEYKGELVIDRLDQDGLGGHGLSIVGYDDNIWVDINYDGQVQNAEMGAFKLVNSWGPGWGNDGFVWLAYDALNAKSQVLTDADQTRINADITSGKLKANKVNNSNRTSFFMYAGVSCLKLKEKDTSNCLCYISVNTGSRKDMRMSVTATHKETGKTYTYDFPSLIHETANYAWDGSTKSTDATMVFDLDNAISDISSETIDDYTWTTKFEDTINDKYSVTVKDVYFTVNGSKKYVTNISKVPLNGSSKTYTMNLKSANVKDPAIEAENSKNVVLYYANSNYKDANLHYRIGSGSWTTVPGVQMCTTDEQSGYNWKYVIHMGSASSVTVCFNENNSKWDSNNNSNYVISKAGCYGIKNGSINTLQEVVVTEVPTIELESTNLSLNLYEVKDMKATVEEADVSDINWTSSNENVVMVSSTGKIVAVGEGSATIKATIGKVSASCTVTVTKEAEVKASAIKLDKSSVNLKKGDVTKFVATVTGKTNSKVDWTCSNENVAIVSGTGKMAAIGVGTATITASIDGLSASCKVTVSESQVVVTKPTVTVSAGDKQATVKWNTVSGATKYQVCSYVGGKYTVQVNNYTGTSYTVTGLANGTKYGFLVRAYINGAWTSYSTADLVYATPATSTKPVVTVTPGSGQVTVKWNTVSGATKYQVCSYVGGKYTVQINNYTGTSYTVTGLTKGTKYGFLVRAYVNGAWTSYSTADLVYTTPS